MDIPAPLGQGAVRPTALPSVGELAPHGGVPGFVGTEGVTVESIVHQVGCLVFTDGHGVMTLTVAQFDL